MFRGKPENSDFLRSGNFGFDTPKFSEYSVISVSLHKIFLKLNEGFLWLNCHELKKRTVWSDIE